jgi:signal transduction histidine kinase
MTGLLARLTPPAWLPAPRPTARLRLTLLYGALFLLTGATLLAVTYLLFDQASAVIKFPGGVQVSFGTLPRNPFPPPEHPGALTSQLMNKLTPAQTAEVQAQVAQLHAFALHELLVRSGIALGLTAVISIALGWLVAGRVLRPVRTISATARQISASNLDERLSLDGPDDEFRELAATLDGLLERLEAAFDSQRRFVANASHELRTPLTLDRALLERALRNPEPTHAFWRATCERLLASSEQQDHLIDALLTLARGEGGLSSYDTFDLSAVIETVLLSPELDTGTAGISVRTEIGPAAVRGDPRLVERLVRNLVDNAIRYNQPSGRVQVTAATRSGHAVLIVSNTGPVIPAAHIDRLFQPFQRLAPNRSSQRDGNGLGLSIVKAIADAHDARITAIPQPDGGLSMEVRFPTPTGTTTGLDPGFPVGFLVRGDRQVRVVREGDFAAGPAHVRARGRVLDDAAQAPR